MTTPRETIGHRLLRLRNANRLSVCDLAGIVGMETATIHGIEAGYLDNINDGDVANLAEALNTTADRLMRGLISGSRDRFENGRGGTQARGKGEW